MLLLGWRCSCSITNPGKDAGCKSSCYTLQSTRIYKGTIWFPTMQFHIVNSGSRKTINVEYLQWQKWQIYCRMKIRKIGWRQEIACSHHYINTSTSGKCGKGKHSITKKSYKYNASHFPPLRLIDLCEMRYIWLVCRGRLIVSLTCVNRWDEKKYIDTYQSYQKRKKNSFLISWHI